MSGDVAAVETTAGDVRVGDRVSYVGVRYTEGVVTKIERFDSDGVVLFLGETVGAFHLSDALTKWVTR